MLWLFMGDREEKDRLNGAGGLRLNMLPQTRTACCVVRSVWCVVHAAWLLKRREGGQVLRISGYRDPLRAKGYEKRRRGAQGPSRFSHARTH